MGSFTSRDVCVQLFMKSENLRRDWNWSEDVKWRRVNRTPSSQLIGPSEDGGSGGVWLSRVTGSSVERFRPHPSQQQLADVLTDAVCLRCFWHTQLHTPAEKKTKQQKRSHESSSVTAACGRSRWRFWHWENVNVEVTEWTFHFLEHNRKNRNCVLFVSS